jgi:hypothetical protein
VVDTIATLFPVADAKGATAAVVATACAGGNPAEVDDVKEKDTAGPEDGRVSACGDETDVVLDDAGEDCNDSSLKNAISQYLNRIVLMLHMRW